MNTMSQAALLTLALIIFSISYAFAGESVFQVGKKYYFAGLSSNGHVKILEKPDKNGWIKVKGIDGKFKGLLGEEGYLNSSVFIVAREIKEP